jgi:enamine deaminase RidA (YjgF/YER057c/UK114 family)
MCAHKIVQPDGWPAPKGYVNGVVATGRTVWIAGQIGRDAAGRFAADLTGQIELALGNVAVVLAAAGATPEHIVRMTWYVVDIADYDGKQRDIGEAYRRVMGRNFPAMTMVEVRRLVERAALVEIEATAVLPERM